MGDMHCFEFNDGGGITFGIIAASEEEAIKCAAEDCEEDVSLYKVSLMPDDEAKRREVLDEETGLRQTIYTILAEWENDGHTGAAMLWHSEM